MENINKEYNELKIENKRLFDLYYEDCTFNNCLFINLELYNSIFINCKFNNCTINNIKGFSNSKIDRLEISNSNIISINYSEFLPNSLYQDPIKSLTNSSLKYNNFHDLSFKKINFKTNDITNSYFSNCNLSYANFSSTNLENTEFNECNLECSDFRYAKLYKINVNNSKLKKAKFTLPDVLSLLNSLNIDIEV